MAQLTSFDQLNSLSSTSIDETVLKRKIEQYFDEMDLPQDEKEQRIGLATDLEILFRNLFAMMLFASALGNDLEEKTDSFSNYAYTGMIDAMVDNDYSNDTEHTGLGYIEQYAKSRTKEIVDLTILHMADNYYLSADRALAISLDETNAIANYNKEMKAIAQGYTKKTWLCMMDGKERTSHNDADGQTVDIFQPFEVGDSQLMFPLDRSLGASLREICRCRCTVIYGGKKENSFIYKDDDVQAYQRPVIDTNVYVYDRIVSETMKHIEYNWISNAKNNLYVSKNVELKGKGFNEIDNNVSKTLDILKINKENAPKYIIVKDTELMRNAVAVFVPDQNSILINEHAISSKRVLELQEDFTMSQNPISTLVHETIHWMDYQQYKKQNTNDTYANWVALKSKNKLDKLVAAGYNIYKISKYAREKYIRGDYAETYTEYRVYQLLRKRK